ncbi:uncharacterized protein LOC121255235 [Juglans microcarpa x Juglans regia]|uniref:uncharacterized protein LOC121255235 n=1 Tax=Juglans microcarpa x Juglans regia TaxID=2249226 RepID=UPI001B7EA72D|nr:uncharacterized protein LOC121255235 [Juglans microcarpa x Juglans regia]
MHPPNFDGRSDPKAVEDWIQDIEEIFRALECTDQQKLWFIAFKLTGEAKRWWNSEKAIREAEGTRMIKVPQFKIITLCTYPIPNEEKKAQKFEEGLNHKIYERVIVQQIHNFSELVHQAMLVEQNLKKGAELQE